MICFIMNFVSFSLHVCFFCFVFHNSFSYCKNNSCQLNATCSFNESYFTLPARDKSFSVQCKQQEKLLVEVDSVNHEYREVILKLKLPDSCYIVNPSQPEVEDNDNDESISIVTVLIIVLIFIIVYFACGAFFKLMNGASGIEILPHYQFFQNLGSLLRDGVLYCARGCQSSTSYDRI